ncbi:MAG: peptidase T [Planctomycetes bacterium]|nr:peptidase T [Planctomycetota bacterium]
MISADIRDFARAQARERFLRYVEIHTTSDETSKTHPSTARQWDLLRLLADECRELGLIDVHLGMTGYVYATLPASDGVSAEPFGLVAHVDTSPEQPGKGVTPRCHENWDGSPIHFPEDPALTLTVEDSPELAHFVGDTIITASGRTLLGADDKAGVAEIMAAVATLVEFPDLRHGEIRVCFTSDEEIGRGTEGIELDRLPKYCYTMDGGFQGELETECFDAWRADLTFHGVGVHPGTAKGVMVHAGHLMARYLAELPENETPERTDGRDGFFYLVELEGTVDQARASLILRDFEAEKNAERRERLQRLADAYRDRHPRLRIELEFREQYRNMRDILAACPEVVERAHLAIADTGLEVLRHPIRGGTDGSVLSQLGHPTPNIFAGGLMFHSKREWIAESALARATETILHLARRWAESS